MELDRGSCISLPTFKTEYSAFFSQGAAIMTGFGFTGYTENGGSKWNGAANVDIMRIEFPSNFKVLLDSWNMKTNIWLRECIYKRVTPKGVKPGFASSMLTFATSAFWHGFAGGYYLTFILGGFIQTAQRMVRKDIRPIFLSSNHSSTIFGSTWLKCFYDLLLFCWIWTNPLKDGDDLIGTGTY